MPPPLTAVTKLPVAVWKLLSNAVAAGSATTILNFSHGPAEVASVMIVGASERPPPLIAVR